jgi:hypothetical protein
VAGRAAGLLYLLARIAQVIAPVFLVVAIGYVHARRARPDRNGGGLRQPTLRGQQRTGHVGCIRRPIGDDASPRRGWIAATLLPPRRHARGRS